MTKKLLLVDDDALVLATFGRGLRDAGYTVLVAATGEEAVAMVAKDYPDLVILDIRMPGLSGIDVSKHLNELGVPVVHLSAYDDQETLHDALEQGALGYLVKPIDVAKAIPTIETALKRANDLQRLQATEGRLNRALDTANVVNFAVGIISERHRIDRQKAFDLIRDQARSERRKVKEIAREILDATDYINRFGTEKS
ncbi:ANTAR domain-containing response regulator [Sedimenticola sp.]|uniref:ANTAR domain-containing response regulator n=1 Tax=Sedimenticola sp. TaxID=1940285 RepID=UPI00258A3D28|nr:response regulator [Sedimenticola sp.]MCW8902635.1 response regulator [Sedimenticola sp.]